MADPARHVQRLAALRARIAGVSDRLVSLRASLSALATPPAVLAAIASPDSAAPPQFSTPAAGPAREVAHEVNVGPDLPSAPSDTAPQDAVPIPASRPPAASPDSVRVPGVPVGPSPDLAQEMERLLASVPDQPRHEAVQQEERDVLDLEPDLLQSLVDEAAEVEQAVQEGLEAWSSGRSAALAEARRGLHTLKGLVRMAGGRALGRRIHELEADLEDAGTLPLATRPAIAASFQEIATATHAFLSPQAEDTPAASRDQVVRVHASLVDRLFRENDEARLAALAVDSAVGDCRAALRDLHDITQGLSRALRELDAYAESQIQSRRAQLLPGEEFDPLELDRYTVLQELSRMLSEGAADAVDMHRDLARRLADQETLITAQMKSISGIRAGLHEARLTPVEGMVHDRFYKIVWKTAHELGKSVTFSVDSGHLELDRGLLERMLAPVEHALRNAVDHGIESPAERRAAGKPDSGHVDVKIRQQAGRVVIQVNDDGRGLDVERIRAKAERAGLWPRGAGMDEAQAADMVCHPGFSTASTVTQISGRGVGMDVVRATVLGMGGRFLIQSRPGHGLSVNMQIPTSTASARVLVVAAGTARWALSLDTVEDVERASGDWIAAALASATAGLPDGTTVPCRELAALAGLPSKAAGAARPVVWLRDGVSRMAMVVDALVGVIEAPLHQVDGVWRAGTGIVGATLLPDGHPAFLLDPLRASPVQPRREESAGSAPVIMVVDDSITVRKATGRFLERLGYRVATAKDGHEAMQELASGLAPAMVLLDVEMPRMNGFECLDAIRQDARHRHLPVVMVTSRTADKHRRRAAALGVQGYLGKPFQENELATLLATHAPIRHAQGPARPAPPVQ